MTKFCYKKTSISTKILQYKQSDLLLWFTCNLLPIVFWPSVFLWLILILSPYCRVGRWYLLPTLMNILYQTVEIFIWYLKEKISVMLQQHSSWMHSLSVLLCLVGKIVSFKPLSPNIHIQILETDRHTFPEGFSWENVTKDQRFSPWVIILILLITFALGHILMLLGENWC